MTKFTKGPWVVCNSKRIEGVSDPRCADYLADIKHHHLGSADRVPSDAEQSANANLFAAAPSMYQALENLLAEWKAERFEWSENRAEVLSLQAAQPTTGGTLFDLAEAALKLARGEGQ